MVEIQQLVAVLFALAVMLVFAAVVYAPAVARGSRTRTTTSRSALTTTTVMASHTVMATTAGRSRPLTADSASAPTPGTRKIVST